jgi:hypothetical protein
MSADIVANIAQAKKHYQSAVRNAAMKRDDEIKHAVESAVEEIALLWKTPIESFEVDFGGKCHAAKSGVVFKITFPNYSSVSYQYCESLRVALLYLTARYKGQEFKFTPEHTDRIAQFRSIFDDPERNDFSTVEDRMRAAAWRYFAMSFNMSDLVSFAQQTFDLYVKIIAALHPKREFICRDSFIPNVYVTKLIEVNVCCKADVVVQLPKIGNATLEVVEDEESIVQILHKEDEFASSCDVDESIIHSVRARINDLTTALDAKKKKKMANISVESLLVHDGKVRAMEKEIEELWQILAVITGNPVDIKGVSVRVYQDEDWLQSINEKVVQTAEEDRAKRLILHEKEMKAKTATAPVTSPLDAKADARTDAVVVRTHKRGHHQTAALLKRKEILQESMGDILPTSKEQYENRLEKIRLQLAERAADPHAHTRAGLTKQMFAKETRVLERERDNLQSQIDGL